MNKHIILNILKLKPSEKMVLEVIEKQKIAQNASKIARSASIPRTTTLYILEKLLKWKLVKRIRLNNRYQWMPTK